MMLRLVFYYVLDDHFPIFTSTYAKKNLNMWCEDWPKAYNPKHLRHQPAEIQSDQNELYYAIDYMLGVKVNIWPNRCGHYIQFSESFFTYVMFTKGWCKWKKLMIANNYLRSSHWIMRRHNSSKKQACDDFKFRHTSRDVDSNQWWNTCFGPRGGVCFGEEWCDIDVLSVDSITTYANLVRTEWKPTHPNHVLDWYS